MRKMTQGSIARHLIAYALPLILGNLFQLTYNAVDSIVIGKFAGENALAAVSAANPVMTIVILGVSGVSIGASVLMSRFYGAGDEDALRREVATTIVFGAIASLVVFAVGWPLSGPVLRLMNVPDEILEMAARYLQVIFVGFLFTFQYNILAAALRSVGDSRTPVVYLALASVMNAGLDVLLVAGLRWGRGRRGRGDGGRGRDQRAAVRAAHLSKDSVAASGAARIENRQAAFGRDGFFRRDYGASAGVPADW